MAIDTDTRKFSAMNPMCPWRGVNLVPSGALDQPEMAAALYLYNEIDFSTVTDSGYVYGPFSFSWWRF